LSLTTSGSSTNAAFGSVSAGGIGTPEFEVTHTGGGPWAFVASQSGGNAGGVALSKFSLNTTGSKQGGEHEGVGGDVGAKLESACDENTIVNIASSKKVNLTTALNRFKALFLFVSCPMLLRNFRETQAQLRVTYYCSQLLATAVSDVGAVSDEASA
jgi:hypothetical protein